MGVIRRPMTDAERDKAMGVIRRGPMTDAERDKARGIIRRAPPPRDRRYDSVPDDELTAILLQTTALLRQTIDAINALPPGAEGQQARRDAEITWLIDVIQSMHGRQ
jgi:hypothetical protein